VEICRVPVPSDGPESALPGQAGRDVCARRRGCRHTAGRSPERGSRPVAPSWWTSRPHSSREASHESRSRTVGEINSGTDRTVPASVIRAAMQAARVGGRPQPCLHDRQTVTHCSLRCVAFDTRYPICTGSVPSVRSNGSAQIGVFCRVGFDVFWRMHGEIRQLDGPITLSYDRYRSGLRDRPVPRASTALISLSSRQPSNATTSALTTNGHRVWCPAASLLSDSILWLDRVLGGTDG